ncbi:MAG: flagellar assembly protein FliW [Eubacteriales bacterium]
MELETKYFGAVRCDEESVLHFSEGLFGFEYEKEFLLIPFEGSGESMLCFQSVHTPTLAFVAMNPFFLNKAYAPILTEKELASMGVSQSEDLCYYTLCVVKEPLSRSTVNFKCPIVINDVTRKAKQVILDQYEMRHLLSDFAGKEGASC